MRPIVTLLRHTLRIRDTACDLSNASAVRAPPGFVSVQACAARSRAMSVHATPPAHPFKKQRLASADDGPDDDAAFNASASTSQAASGTSNTAAMDSTAGRAEAQAEPVASSSSASSSAAVAPQSQPQPQPQPPLPSAQRLSKPLPPELISSYDPANFPAELPQSTSVVNYRQGLFLAPMVRIGALPTRLLSLEYGADLVWGPEIIDRAIMGSERVVDQHTGAVHFIKDGKAVFSTHPIERPHIIFQLGCATPAWAYEAVKLVTEHDDVAGVDLNCGCPKNFSTTGGMGAGLLPRPDLLCDILRAMRRAAPPHVAVTCKLRLLPTEEATKALIRQICRTGAVDAITIHCRTKEMRPREKALLDRIGEVVDTVREETGGKMPVCHNGDSWDFAEAHTIMQASGVTSSMLARGAEKNPSCFRPGPQACSVDEVVPKWLKYAVCFDNAIGNTKYCLNVLDWHVARPKHMKRDQLLAIKEAVARAKTNEDMCRTDYYKDTIDVAKCKDEYETYVLGDLAAVLAQRRERGQVAGAVSSQSVPGAVERATVGSTEDITPTATAAAV
ncbi:unnamed protein product [Parajaminaea phylloscopi]